MLGAAEPGSPLTTRLLQLHVLRSSQAEDVFPELCMQRCKYTWLTTEISTDKNKCSCRHKHGLALCCSSPQLPRTKACYWGIHTHTQRGLYTHSVPGLRPSTYSAAKPESSDPQSPAPCQTDDPLISQVPVPRLQLPQSLAPKPLNPAHWLALCDTHEQAPAGILAKAVPTHSALPVTGTAGTRAPVAHSSWAFRASLTAVPPLLAQRSLQLTVHLQHCLELSMHTRIGHRVLLPSRTARKAP